MLAAVVLAMVFLGGRAMASSVNLTWVPSTTPQVTGYEIYYGGASGVYTNYVFVSASSNDVVISGLTPGVTYYFNAASLDGNGDQSAYAGEVSYTTPSSTLSSVAMTGNSMNLILGVNANPNITGYEVYYGSASGVYTNYTYVPASATNLVIKGLVSGVTYYFNAQPLNSSGVASGMLGEISYTVPSQGSVVPVQGVVLSLSAVRTGGIVSSYILTASGQVPASWKIEQSMDLVNWSPFYYGVGGSVNLTIPASSLGMQFFRLSKN